MSREITYVHRRVLNEDEIREHYEALGIDTTEHPLHLTVVYSPTPVEDVKSLLDTGKIEIQEDIRGHKVLGDMLTLLIPYEDIHARNALYALHGATSDFDTYQPHISIAFDAPLVDTPFIPSYTGEIVLGPEILRIEEE